MEKIKIGLFAAIVVLLLVEITGRDLDRQNLRHLRDGLQDVGTKVDTIAGSQVQAGLTTEVQTLQASMQALQASVQSLHQDILALAHAPRPAGPTGSPSAVPSTATPGSQVGQAAPAAPTASAAIPTDGKVVLGRNFLLPYQNTFNPAWLHGTLREFDQAPDKLNPILGQSSEAAAANGLVNDSLCTRDGVHPELWRQQLATSLTISDDYRVYTFTIRKGVMWQRPPIANQPQFAWLNRDVELTAKDFVFMIQMTRNPDVENPGKTYYEDLDRAEAVDRYTLRLVWKKRVYTSLEASMELSPLPRHIYGCDRNGAKIPTPKLGIEFNNHWFDAAGQLAGVGGYVLQDFQPDKQIVFVRNPAYWGGTLHFKRIVWNGAVKDPDAELVAFKDGQASASGLTPGQYKGEIIDHHEPRFAAIDPANPKAGRTGDFAWERVKGNAFTYIGWNMRTALFNDRRVRQAMSYAFPKQQIIRDIYFGLGEPILSDVSPSSVYCNHDLKPYAFDLAKAKALLAQAGWTDTDGDGWVDKVIDGKRTPLRFMVKYMAHSPEWDRVLETYQRALRSIGVDLQYQAYEWKQLLTIYQKRDFDAVVGGWQMDDDVDYFQLWYSGEADKPDSSNFCGFKNAEVDRLAVELRATFEPDRRIAIAKRIQAILNLEQPYTFFRSAESIFIWQNKGPPAKDRYLDGVIRGLDGFYPLHNRNPVFWHFRE